MELIASFSAFFFLVLCGSARANVALSQRRRNGRPNPLGSKELLLPILIGERSQDVVLP